MHLAELEAGYTREKSRLDALNSTLFRRLGTYYQARDRLRLLVEYRRRHLDSLVQGRVDEEEKLDRAYREAEAQAERDYQEAADAVANAQAMTAAEEKELVQLWRKLVKLYHPDRFAEDPAKLETYQKLTAAINLAKDSGDIATLREIADDPNAFILRQGWLRIDFREEEELRHLRRLYETLQLEILSVLESVNRMRESPEYELCRLTEEDAGALQRVSEQRTKLLESERAKLESEAEALARDIAELTGSEPEPKA